MLLTYSASVVLLSLAIYGILCILYDLWACYRRRSRRQPSSLSLLIFVQNEEDRIEYLLYELTHRLEQSERACDAVIIDCGSEDMTYEIAARSRSSPVIGIFRVAGKARPLSEALSLCRGSVIHVLDLVSRLPFQECLPVVEQLLRPDSERI